MTKTQRGCPAGLFLLYNQGGYNGKKNQKEHAGILERSGY